MSEALRDLVYSLLVLFAGTGVLTLIDVFLTRNRAHKEKKK